MKYTNDDLKELQSKSLEEKIQISSARIIEWYERWGGKVYVSFSGGKDSIVLLHLVRRIYPDTIAMYVNTGLEYPEIVDFVGQTDNVRVVFPMKYDRSSGEYKRYTFQQVLTDTGYPIISKEQSGFIEEYRCTHSTKLRSIRMHGNKYGMGKISDKYKYLIDSDFKISDRCCDFMKKNPSKKFEKDSGLKPFLGTMAFESKQRESQWKEHGCNSFDAKRPKSAPLSFWTEQDVLQYIKKYHISYASVYGDLVSDENGKLHFTGCQRTGCVFCGFGCHLEKEPNRFQMLKKTHPKLYDYCMRGGKYDDEGMWVPDKGLGMDKVLKYIGVKTDYDVENQDIST